MKPFVMPKYRDWYKVVIKDHSLLPEALDYFSTNLDAFMDVVKVEGRLVDLLKFNAGNNIFYRNSYYQLGNLAAYWENRVDRLHAKLCRAWEANPPSKLRWTTADIRRLVEDEPELAAERQVYQEIKYLFDQYSGIVESVKQAGYTLKNLTDLTVHGLTDVDA